jgi:hypothetical protein
MSSESLPQGLFSEFAGNQRLVVGAVISFIHASAVILLLLKNPTQWQFFVYASIPTLVTVVIPFLVTGTFIKGIYTEESLESFLRTLAESTGEIPEAVEVEITDEIREQLPAEVEDPDSVKLVDEELLEHVDGEEFDPVDKDTRGVVAMAFSLILIVPSAPTVGLILGGIIPPVSGVVTALIAARLVLQQHREISELIEYTPYTINP